MLNLYAVKVWHNCEPRHFQTIEVRTYSARRAEDLATESYPGCKVAASLIGFAREEPALPPAPPTHAAHTGADLRQTSNTTRPDG
jgi:hypothetical protein